MMRYPHTGETTEAIIDHFLTSSRGNDPTSAYYVLKNLNKRLRVRLNTIEEMGAHIGLPPDSLNCTGWISLI